jgi:16S rRNA (uracil1498-N3)-methyltransferase
MQLPFFYIDPASTLEGEIELDEENSRHVVQVLRLKRGDGLHLTDGRGHFITASVVDDHKKHCRVKVESLETFPERNRQITIGISLLKNTSRFEWFLEKASELGVSRIIPLICKRTEKEKFRMERLLGICISAMLQSRQVWLTRLDEVNNFERALPDINSAHKFIGYCDSQVERKGLASLSPFTNASILIGPEGDFTPEEFHFAESQGFTPVSLGDTRLRTETAGIVAASVLMSV